MPYFYDSYAVLAYLSGHKGYRRFFEKGEGYLTVLNLIEICFAMLRTHGEQAAKEAIQAFSRYVVDFTLDDILGAVKLRLEFRGRGRALSYCDALGYYLSEKLKVKFLTGDKDFRGLENIKFVE